MARQNDSLANFGATTNLELSVTTTGDSWGTLETESSPAYLRVQNVGTVPVFYRLTVDAGIAANKCTTASTKYTGILAAGDADEDGTGGVESFAGYTGGLSFCTASGTGKVNISYSGRLGD
jgi:hypothetical protein